MSSSQGHCTSSQGSEIQIVSSRQAAIQGCCTSSQGSTMQFVCSRQDATGHSRWEHERCSKYINKTGNIKAITRQQCVLDEYA